MTNAEKRARQKQRRAEIVRQRDAQLRRRRIARVVSVVASLAIVVGLAFFGTGGDERAGQEPGPRRSRAPAAVAPTPEGPPACGADLPPPATPELYNDPPPMKLE